MSNYTQIIKQLLWQQYHDRQTQTITISTLNIKFIPLKAQEMLQAYSCVKFLTITHCDLRKLENFPILPCLADLDLSYNSLQGTFNYLMPLKSLKYLNISNNIISDFHVLEPLRRLGKVDVYLKDNPFTELNNWKGKMRLFNITVLKDPKSIGKSKNVVVKEEEEKSIEKEKDDSCKRQGYRQRDKPRPFAFGSYREKLMAGLQNNLEAEYLNAPVPVDIPFQNFQIEQVDALNNPIALPQYESDSELGLQMQNDNNEEQRELELVADEYSQNFDEDNDNDEGQEQEEADEPYF